MEVWRCSGLMICALYSGSSGPGSVSLLGHCVVFLVKTLNFHSASHVKWSRNTPGCFMLQKQG